MLETLTSMEIAEWAAYEKYSGPVDNSWRDEMLASIHDRLLQLNYTQVKAHFKSDSLDEPERTPRPWELDMLAKRKALEESDY